MLVKLDNWLHLPGVMDKTANLYLDSEILNTITRNMRLDFPTGLQDMITSRVMEYASIKDATIIKNLYYNHFPELWTESDPIGPLIPISMFTRALEILESWMSPHLGCELYTPITGTVIFLRQRVPFILIAGITFIPFSITKLIIPNLGSGNNQLLLNVGQPIRIHNWLLLHLKTAAIACRFPLETDLIIPISNILSENGINVYWERRRCKIEYFKFLRAITAASQNIAQKIASPQS